MSSEVVFCKKFKLPLIRIYRGVTVIDYPNIKTSLKVVSDFKKTTCYAILKLSIKGSFIFVYSKSFDDLYRRLTKAEQTLLNSNNNLQVEREISNVDGHYAIIVRIVLPNKEYTISDWGRIIDIQDELTQ